MQQCPESSCAPAPVFLSDPFFFASSPDSCLLMPTWHNVFRVHLGLATRTHVTSRASPPVKTISQRVRSGSTHVSCAVHAAVPGPPSRPPWTCLFCWFRFFVSSPDSCLHLFPLSFHHIHLVCWNPPLSQHTLLLLHYVNHVLCEPDHACGQPPLPPSRPLPLPLHLLLFLTFLLPLPLHPPQYFRSCLCGAAANFLWSDTGD